MAKRKRLSPATPQYLDIETGAPRRALTPGAALGAPGAAGTAGTAGAAGGSGEPPIAQVARESAATAALEEVTAELSAARAEGRLIQALPLEAIQRDYLVRDRIVVEDEDMAALRASLAARGQQTPVEVVDLGQGGYGLISGWRRLRALETLLAETGEARFATVQAVLRQPETAGAAYTAMVEENEIRVGLSPFERARIVAKAVEQGVFPDTQSALRALFATASRAKRSKIGSFLRIVAAFEADLRHPGAIAERLGLRMAKALDTDPGFAGRLRAALAATPPDSPEAELALIEAALRPPAPDTDARARRAPPQPAQLEVARHPEGLLLKGAGLTPQFEARLKAWLRKQAG